MKVKGFRDLLIWQKSMVLVREIYFYSRTFPKEEKFGLTQQIRRAAVSIPSNIAEGYGRASTSDYKRFLRIALGSLYETETQLEISKTLQFSVDKQHFDNILLKVNELEKMIYSLSTKLL